METTLRVFWSTESAPDRDSAYARLVKHYADRVVVFVGVWDGVDAGDCWEFTLL